jgi:hypothetical protein
MEANGSEKPSPLTWYKQFGTNTFITKGAHIEQLYGM